jgi:hypothetical protein
LVVAVVEIIMDCLVDLVAEQDLAEPLELVRHYKEIMAAQEIQPGQVTAAAAAAGLVLLAEMVHLRQAEMVAQVPRQLYLDRQLIMQVEVVAVFITGLVQELVGLVEAEPEH